MKLTNVKTLLAFALVHVCSASGPPTNANVRAALNAASKLPTGTKHPIEHVIVLMLENRAFDHMLGWMKRDNDDINGLTGAEYNLMDPANAESGKVYVHDNASYVDPDPGHSVSATTTQIFGGSSTTQPGKMDGFVFDAQEKKIPVSSVMSGFKPNDVPVITTLASEFALVDAFHAGIPGPTLPNRLMFHSATSHGSCTNNVWEQLIGHPQKPIYEALEEAGASWTVYFEEAPDTLILDWMRQPQNLPKYKWLSNLETDLRQGTLSNFSFINPVFFSLPGLPASDQHPSHDVVDGELLIKKVYDELRNSSLWEKTLLIVTYDEHGGFYDHVTPPSEGVPSPDGLNCTDINPPFDFRRLGVRIPCILVSPWINKGVVEHEPIFNKPTPTSAYDLTSIASTLHYHFNTSSFLTERDAWSAPLNHLFSNRTSPRTDCPMEMPSPPVGSQAFRGLRGRYLSSGAAPLSDLHKDLVTLAAHLELEGETSQDLPHKLRQASRLSNEMEGSMYVRERVNRFLKKDPYQQPTHPLYRKHTATQA